MSAVALGAADAGEVLLVDAGGANLGSVRYAFERLGARVRIGRDPAEVLAAPRLVLPGVGAAGTAMACLRRLGLVEALRLRRGPTLGICLGMQLLFESSAEGEAECLGLLPGRVVPLPAGPGLRVPHMGWNALEPRRADPLLEGMGEGATAYFVHSYAAPAGEYTLATTRHGTEFSAVVRRGNCWGVQFHPERSAAAGARILRNFLEGPLE